MWGRLESQVLSEAVSAFRFAIKDRLFTYSRVSPDISVEGLSRLGLDHIAVDDVYKIDCVDALDQWLLLRRT